MVAFHESLRRGPGNGLERFGSRREQVAVPETDVIFAPIAKVLPLL